MYRHIPAGKQGSIGSAVASTFFV